MFDILKIEKNTQSGEKWLSLKLHDKKEKQTFWIDCSLIDGYGNYKDFKTDDLYIDWQFNQYIFNLDYMEDMDAKEYQENYRNVENITDFIDEKNDYLVNILKNMEVNK